MTTLDPFALARSRDSFTLEDAARLVCDVPLSRPFPNRRSDWTQELRDQYGQVMEALRVLQADAASLGVEVTEHPAEWSRRENFVTGECTPRLSKPQWTEYGKVTRSALVAWCKAKGLRPAALSPPEGQPDSAPAGAAEMSAFPPELAAAIEAFHAVRNDPRALSGTSPKQALCAWLESNRPELSKKAHDRIATVANWQPSGGAPKTPTGGT